MWNNDPKFEPGGQLVFFNSNNKKQLFGLESSGHLVLSKIVKKGKC